MARCKKSYEDQLKAVEEQIAKVQEKLNHVKKARGRVGRTIPGASGK